MKKLQCCGSRSRSFLSASKKVRKILFSTIIFLLLFVFLSLKTDVNVPSKSNEQKNLWKKPQYLLAFCQPPTKKQEPDLYQNVKDPQHWKKGKNVDKNLDLYRPPAEEVHRREPWDCASSSRWSSSPPGTPCPPPQPHSPLFLSCHQEISKGVPSVWIRNKQSYTTRQTFKRSWPILENARYLQSWLWPAFLKQ